MSLYSVGRNLLSGENRVDGKIGTAHAIGGAIGGVLGKQTFSAVKALFADPKTVGAVQSACLALLTIGTFIYTINKNRIETKQIKNLFVCFLIGLALGILSRFLCIGGGPINLVILYYFFSMETKTAARNSLYIIMISQITSLLTTLLTASVPDFQWLWLLVMAAGGIAGGVTGRIINRTINTRQVEKLFLCLMIVIVGISTYNSIHYFSNGI